MSRFGYLRTPMPLDASPAAQADAHVCLLDALGIRQATVLGASTGGPSAMQMAIRHPDRVSALVLLVPLAWKPGVVADSGTALRPMVERVLMQKASCSPVQKVLRRASQVQKHLIRYLSQSSKNRHSREGGNPVHSCGDLCSGWIPAFAGMTDISSK